MIDVQNLSKTFRVHHKEPGLKGSVRSLFRRKWVEKHALRSVSLKVDEGEILGLIGANGAGKTTLVKLAAGIIHPSSGHLKVLGHTPFERDNDFRRQISLIMGQKAQLWWDLPAADCFLLIREIYQLPKDRFQASLDFLAATLGVEKLLTTQVRRLSLGERMKMELIAALLHAPRIVFLDEPTIGLDITAQKAVRKFLLDYRRVHHPAMILTSHYMEDIERLCERIVILREGEVVYDGPLAQVVGRYARHKTVHVRLKGELPHPVKAGSDLHDLLSIIPTGVGEVYEADDSVLKVRVQRPKATDVSAAMLQQLPVLDLTIEEEDIATIIESIMRGGLA